MKHFALCLSNDFGEEFLGDDVLPGLVYESLGEERGAAGEKLASGDLNQPEYFLASSHVHL